MREPDEARPLTVIGLGGLTNSINGLVSSSYFVRVMGWEPTAGLYRSVVLQGLFEGLCFGVLLSAIFVVAHAVITGARAPFAFGARHLAGMWLGALASWALGGVIGLSYAALSPEGFLRTFPLAGRDGLLGFAWVGGSIWGVELGGVVSVVVGIVWMRFAWRARVREAAPAEF